MTIDITRVLVAVDNRDYNFYDRLTDTEKKELTPYVLMRYISSTDGSIDIQEWFIERTNELVNKDHWLLSKQHKELLWNLSAGCGIGVKQRHQYIKAPSKGKADKLEKLLLELHPMSKLEDIKLLASLMSKDEKMVLFNNLGFDKKQRKEYE